MSFLKNDPEKNSLIFCDFDGTLFDGNVSALFGKFLLKKKIISKGSYLLLVTYYLLFFVRAYPLKAFHEKAFTLFFKGKSKKEIEKEAIFFYETVKNRLFPFTKNFIEKASKKGAFIVLCSSSPAFLLNLWKEDFPVDAIFATEYEEDKEGRFSKIATLIDGFKKRDLFLTLKRKHSHLYPKTVALSDSLEDLPSLLEAEEVILINPSFYLKLYAKHNWKCIACKLDY